MRADSIIGAVQSATKLWCKQRKAEERDALARHRRQHLGSSRVDFTKIAEQILPDAYLHASGGGKFTVPKRQLYYASRDKFFELTGRHINAKYLTGTVLVQYLNSHKVDWKITADPRGNLLIPNATNSVKIQVGTLAIDNYLNSLGNIENLDGLRNTAFPIHWPTLFPGQRFAAVCYIEKEGFEPMLQEARIAERFDIAIISCKGQSVCAARKFVDHVCAVGSGIPLFVVHDFDKSGFEIVECLTTESRLAQERGRVAYHFKNKINFIDFGLRLEDVKKYKLASEHVEFQGRVHKSCTKAESEFLRSNRRVELNAFTAPQFIEWIESKLKKHLPERLIPTEQITELAYRRAMAIGKINREMKAMLDGAIEDAKQVSVPKSLRRQLKAKMKLTGEPWDVALHSIVNNVSS